MKIRFIIFASSIITIAIIFSYCHSKSKAEILKDDVRTELKRIKKNRTPFIIDSLQKALESDTSFGVTFATYDKEDSALSIGINPKFDVTDTSKATAKYAQFITDHKLYYGNNIGMIWFVDSRVPDDYKKTAWKVKVLWGTRNDSIFEE